MNNSPTVVLDNVSLKYRRPDSHSNSLRLKLIEIAKREHRYTEYLALDDISFKIDPGETLAVLGANGSGKSTLLKILSKVVQPSAGRVQIRGAISPLLELGAGFNPELTGRENLLLNSAILGRSARQIKESEESIIDWAELANEIDLPLRMYSTGMTARLAFSIATSYIPDLLLIDEVLSVGDYSFQQKSKIRIESLINSGCATVVVSHAPETIRQLSSRAILLKKGKMVADGKSSEVLDIYLSGG